MKNNTKDAKDVGSEEERTVKRSDTNVRRDKEERDREELKVF